MVTVVEKENLEIIIDADSIDYENSLHLRKSISEAAEKNNKALYINLKNVTKIDSLGIGMLVGLVQQYAEPPRRVVLTNVCVEIKKIFREMRLESFFKLQ